LMVAREPEFREIFRSLTLDQFEGMDSI
jgi:hypothetical protein